MQILPTLFSNPLTSICFLLHHSWTSQAAAGLGWTDAAFLHILAQSWNYRKVFSMISICGASCVCPAGGNSGSLLSSARGEQHCLPAQAFPQARLQSTGGREGVSDGEGVSDSEGVSEGVGASDRVGASLWSPWLQLEDAALKANSGCTVVQVAPALCNTLVTSDITSGHLEMWINDFCIIKCKLCYQLTCFPIIINFLVFVFFSFILLFASLSHFWHEKRQI